MKATQKTLQMVYSCNCGYNVVQTVEVKTSYRTLQKIKAYPRKDKATGQIFFLQRTEVKDCPGFEIHFGHE